MLQESKMPIDDDIAQDIFRVVRGGFYNRDEIVMMFCELYSPEELNPHEVETFVDAELAALEEEKTSWPAVTDCDKLDAVFAALNERNIIALQNAGNTQSDGYYDVRKEYESHLRQDEIIGYCFYHRQDLDQAVDCGHMYLAFGPMDPEKEETEGPAVGAVIVEELKRAGFDVEWNGTFQQRIFIPRLDWKRR
jgi:hypothetical protein